MIWCIDHFVLFACFFDEAVPVFEVGEGFFQEGLKVGFKEVFIYRW